MILDLNSLHDLEAIGVHSKGIGLVRLSQYKILFI